MKHLVFFGCLSLCFHLGTAQTFNWVRFIEGGFGDPNDVAVDVSGNVYVTGDINGTAVFDAPNNISLTTTAWQTYLWKLDAAGNVQWVRGIEGTGTSYNSRIAFGPNGNIYLTGSFDGRVDLNTDTQASDTLWAETQGQTDLYLIEVSPSGQFQNGWYFGGPGYDWVFDIAFSPGGNVLLTGTFQQTVDFDPALGTQPSAQLTAAPSMGALQGDAFLLNLSADGIFNWVKSFTGPAETMANGMMTAPNGDIYLCGHFTDSMDINPDPAQTLWYVKDTSTNGFVVRLDSNGHLLWSGHLEGTVIVIPTSLDMDDNGALYVGGYFKDSADFDLQPGVDPNFQFYTDNQLDYLTTGTGFFCKINPNGQMEWVEVLPADKLIHDSPVYQIIVDRNANLVVAGSFYGTLDLDTDPAASFLVATADTTPNINFKNAGFVTRRDVTTGKFLSGYQLGTTHKTSIRAMALEGSGIRYLAGTFTDTVDFDPGPGTQKVFMPPALTRNAYLLKLDGPPLGIIEQPAPSEVLAYPNPSKGEVILSWDREAAEVQVTVWDLSGKAHSRNDFAAISDVRLFLPNQPGLYILEVKMDDLTRQFIRVMRM